jgi:hypothetical protein
LFAEGRVLTGVTVCFACYWVAIGRYIESTDDAYVGGEVTTLSFKVAGVIETVAIIDNQSVKAGDPLLKLDDRDYRTQLARTEANIAARRAAPRSWPSCRLTACGSMPTSRRASSPGCAKAGLQRSSPATGAQFGVLPPENATGNFTKIVQRVPVRILLDDDAAELGKLRPGLSVVVHVDGRQSTGDHVGERQTPPVRDDDRPDTPPHGNEGRDLRQRSSCQGCGRRAAAAAAQGDCIRNPVPRLFRCLPRYPDRVGVDRRFSTPTISTGIRPSPRVPSGSSKREQKLPTGI